MKTIIVYLVTVLLAITTSAYSAENISPVISLLLGHRTPMYQCRETLLADLNGPGNQPYAKRAHFTDLGNLTLFFADHPDTGVELCVTDGTPAGTHIVKDIYPGPDDSIYTADSTLRNMVRVGNKVYFLADDGTHGRELWATDGTASGTYMVMDMLTYQCREALLADLNGLGNQPYAQRAQFTDLGNLTLFFADHPDTGVELWVTDGTPAGAHIVKDIYPGPDDGIFTADSILRDMVRVGDKVYFLADDGTHGRELWATDGTASGTYMVMDMLTGVFPPNAIEIKPSLLFITGAEAVDPPRITSTELIHKLMDKGFVVDSKLWGDIEPGSFNKYDCVIFFTLGQMVPGDEPSGVIAQRMDMLDEYLKSGGSVLANPYLGEAPKDLVASDLFLKKLGAEIQIDDIDDPEREIVQPPWYLRFTWTDKINREFLGMSSEDIYLWYPIGRYKFGMRTCTFKLGEDWTPLAETDNSATLTTRFINVQYFDEGREEETKSGNFPFIAARQVERGRLAVSGIFHPYTFTDPFAISLGGVFTDKGFGERRSCGFEMIVRLLKWLTADSINISRQRPTATNPELLIPLDADRAPILERGTTFASFQYPEQHFVKGAFFELPDSANVMEYISSAKNAGLLFAVFAKRTSGFPEKSESLDQFKQLCLEQSTEDFTAIPAIIITDKYGGMLLFTGKNIEFPNDSIFDSIEDRLVDGGTDGVGDIGEETELGDSWLHYVFAQLGSMNSVIASMDHWKSEYPASDFRDYNSMVVIKCENGEVVENMLTDYLKLQDRGENLLPIALHKISNPEKVTEIADENFWVVRLWEKDIPAYFARNHMLDAPNINITSGPKVNYWYTKGHRDFSNVGDIFDYSRWHFMVKFDLSSDIGLDEVLVYDGDKLYKSFHPNGAKRFVKEFPVLHSAQHNFVLVARDKQGGEVVTAEIFDRSSIGKEFMCGDRNNQFFYSAQRRTKYPHPYFSRSLGYGMAPNKGPWDGESAIYSTFQDDPPHRLRITSFDGAPDNCVAAFTLNPSSIKGEIPLRSAPERVLHTSDVAIGKATLNTGYPDGSTVTNVWHTLLPVLPTRVMDAEVVQKYFIPRPEDDFPTLIQNVNVKFKQQYTPDEDSELLLETMRMNLREPMNWTAKSSNGTLKTGTFKVEGEDSSEAFTLPFGRGAYLRIGEGTSGSYTVVSLTDGLILYEAKNSMNFLIGFPNDGQPAAAESVLQCSFFFIGEPFNVEETNIVERTVNAFLKGDNTSLKISTEIGAILERKSYPILVEAVENVWKAKIESELRVSVPFKISGLNPNVSTYLYYPEQGESRPIEVLDDGTSYVSLPGKGNETVLVCNPIIIDSVQVKCVIVRNAADEWAVYAENESNEPVDVVLEMNPEFKPFEKFADVNLSLAPFESKNIVLK